MLPFGQLVVNPGLESRVQDPGTQQNHYQADVHDRDLVLLIGDVAPKQRRNNEWDRLGQPHEAQCERVMRGFVQLIADDHFLNADRGRKKKGIGYKEPEIGIAERCVRVLGYYCFQVSVWVL